MTCRWLVLALFTLTLATLTGTPLAADQLSSAEPIDMSLEKAALAEVLQSFATIAGARLEMGSGVAGDVTIELRSVPWVEALDRVCREHELVCAMLGGEPPTLSVRVVDPDAASPVPAGFAQAINLSLKSADLMETLTTFGAIAGVEVEVADGVQGSVTLDVRGAPWPLVLNEVCRLNGCRVEWGEDVLRIEAAAGEVPIFNMSLKGADLEETLTNFGVFGILGASALDVRIAPEVSGTVTVDLERVNWQQALGIICDQLHCAWRVVYGEPPVLEVFAPKGEKESLPGVEEPSAKAVKLSYGFTPPGGPRLDGTATFTWAEPIHVVAGAGPVRARLNWIPFGPELSVLLPLIETCEPAQASVSVLDPIVLPLEREVRRQAGGAVLDLGPAAAGAAPEGPPAKAIPACGPGGGGELRVAVSRLAGEDAGPRPKRLQVVERYLLVRPVELSEPVAAVIALGGGPGGLLSLALLSPAEDRNAVEVETLSLAPGQHAERTVGVEGRRFGLSIEYGEQD